MPINVNANHIAEEGGSFEPQRQNNFSFEVSLGVNDKELIVLALHSVPIPAESNDIVEIQYQNEKRKVAGQYTVEDVTLTIRDYVDKDTRGAVMRWRKQVYDPKTGKIGLAKDYKKIGSIILHGPNGEDERVCDCIGSFPQGVSGGNLAHDAGSEQVLIEVTLSVDKLDWSRSIAGA